MNPDRFSFYVSLAATIISMVAAIYATRVSTRQITNENASEFAGRVMDVVRKAQLKEQILKAAANETDLIVRNRLQVEFQTLVTRTDFDRLAARFGTLESSVTLLLTSVGNLGGKIDTFIELQRDRR